MTINDNRGKRGHPFEGCELKCKHSVLGNPHETNHFFSSGVDKIQNKKEGQLTTPEKNACSCLLKSNYPNWSVLYTHNQADNLSVDEEEPLSQESIFSMESIFSKVSQKAEEEELTTESDYIDCSFIGSSAGLLELSRDCCGVSLMHLWISDAVE